VSGPNRLDDLESFYHVLFWIALQYARHELNAANLYDYLTRLFDHALIINDQPYSNSTKISHMTSTTLLERAKFENAPLLDLLLEISVNFRPLYVTPSPSNKKLTKSQINKAQRMQESYQQALETHKDDLNFLNNPKYSNWMEVSFNDAIECSNDEWGPADKVFKEMAPPVFDPRAKRLYSDMRSSNLGHSQGGTFPPDNAEVDVDEDAEVPEEDESEEDIEEDHQPPRTRRRLG
jgi:hypothetical protein